MKLSTRLSISFVLGASLVSRAAAIAIPEAIAIPWAQANPQAYAAANAYADAYAEALAIGHPDPESYALAASADDCATIACHASCGLLIMAGTECSLNSENTYTGPYNTSCLCSSGSSFLQYYAPCMDCGWTLWKYYGGYVSSALAACGTLATEPTGTSRCSTTLTDSYTIDTSVQGCSYLGNCPTTTSTTQGTTSAAPSSEGTTGAPSTSPEESSAPNSVPTESEAPDTSSGGASEAPTASSQASEAPTASSQASEAPTASSQASEGPVPSSDTSSPSSAESSAPSESASVEPLFSGEFSNNVLSWKLSVPSALGPWTSVSLEATNNNSEGAFTYDSAVVTPQSDAEVVSTASNLRISLTSNVESGEDLIIEFTGAIVSGVKFTSDAVLTVVTPDGKKFVKRAEQSWELSNTITVDAGSSSSSSIVAPSGYPNSTLSTSTAVVTQDTTTVVTVTSCSENKCSEVPTTALVSVATTTKNGVVTSYTTYCPLPESTTVVTVTSCEDQICTEVASTVTPGGTSKAPEAGVTTATTSGANVEQQSGATESDSTLTSTVQVISTYQGSGNFIAGSLAGVILPFLFI